MNNTKSIKIISGGQTGVDRAALDFALYLGITCGGYCPKGRKAEDVTIPDFYPLTETLSNKYQTRTKRNIEESDGTIILFIEHWDAGTRLTKKICNDEGKPLWIQDLKLPFSNNEFKFWLEKNRICILNFAGPRESFCPGIYSKSHQFIKNLFS